MHVQDSVQSWVYLFSGFTPEALVLEAFLIFFLLAGYAAFWVIRKRRLGALREGVPTGVVRTYLNSLILEAQGLRSQLFGLLADAGVSPAIGAAIQPTLSALSTPQPGAPITVVATPSGDASAIAQRAAELEAKLVQQQQAMQSFESEKKKLQDEITTLRTQGATSHTTASAGGGDNTAELERKIKQLEERLAEYSIIEDDLANLKRLQQENAKLREQLGTAGAGAIAATGIAAAQATAEAAPATSPDPTPVVAPTPDAGFEGLVDQVEKTLDPAAATPAVSQAPSATPSVTPAAPEPASGATAAASKESSTAESPIDSISTDEDLLSEFEKMLNS